METKDLRPNYFMFGNKGAVWSDKVHIAKAGSFSGQTLCGVPMLSSNHAKIEDVTHIGCLDCIAVYDAENWDYNTRAIKLQ